MLSTGVCAIIEAIEVEQLEVPETTYNFEVEDFHTYYVGTGVGAPVGAILLGASVGDVITNAALQFTLSIALQTSVGFLMDKFFPSGGPTPLWGNSSNPLTTVLLAGAMSFLSNYIKFIPAMVNK